MVAPYPFGSEVLRAQVMVTEVLIIGRQNKSHTVASRGVGLGSGVLDPSCRKRLAGFSQRDGRGRFLHLSAWAAHRGAATGRGSGRFIHPSGIRFSGTLSVTYGTVVRILCSIAPAQRPG